MGCNQSKSLRPKKRKSKVVPAKIEQCKLTRPVLTKKVSRPYFYGSSCPKPAKGGKIEGATDNLTLKSEAKVASNSSRSRPIPVATGISSKTQSDAPVIYDASTLVEELREMFEKFPGDTSIMTRVKRKESLELIQRRRFELRASDEMDKADGLRQTLRGVYNKQSHNKEELIEMAKLRKQQLADPSTIHQGVVSLNAPIRELQKSYRLYECQLYSIVGEMMTREAKAEFYFSLLRKADGQEEEMAVNDGSFPEESQQDLEEYEQGIFPSDTNTSPAATAYRLELLSISVDY